MLLSRSTYRLLTTAPLLLGLAACGAGGGQASPGALITLPHYEPAAARLFDDAIEPGAVGFASVSVPAKQDGALRWRAQASEGVVRLRVATVTVETTRGRTDYHLGARVVGQPLAGGAPPDGSVELTVGATSPSFGLVKSLDARLVGRTFIGFLRRFAGADEVELHWHLAPDADDVATAVREATLLAEIAR